MYSAKRSLLRATSTIIGIAYWINVELMTASKALPAISEVIKEPISITVSPCSFAVIAPAPLAARFVMLTISLTRLIVYSPLTPAVNESNNLAS